MFKSGIQFYICWQTCFWCFDVCKYPIQYFGYSCINIWQCRINAAMWTKWNHSNEYVHVILSFVHQRPWKKSYTWHKHYLNSFRAESNFSFSFKNHSIPMDLDTSRYTLLVLQQNVCFQRLLKLKKYVLTQWLAFNTMFLIFKTFFSK